MAYVKVPPAGCQQEYAGLCQNISCCYCCAEGANIGECACIECTGGGTAARPRTNSAQNLDPTQARSELGPRFLSSQTSEVRKPRGDSNYLLPDNPVSKPKCQNNQSAEYAQWPYSSSSSNNINDHAVQQQHCDTKKCELIQCNATKYTCDELPSKSYTGVRLRNPGLSENFELHKDHYSPGRGHSQVLAEIQCHHEQAACQELSRASQHLRDAASAVDNGWPDRQHYQQELEAVRSQLRSLRNHSAIALSKEPGEGKRLRRESGGGTVCSAPGSRTSPSTSGAAVKRPRDLSPKVAPRSISSQSGVWICQPMSPVLPESEHSDAAYGEDELEEEDGHTVMDRGSESGGSCEVLSLAQQAATSVLYATGSNTPSLVGETLGSISLSEPTQVLPAPLVLPQIAASSSTSAGAKQPLRSSLFSYVPPYVRFSLPEGHQGRKISYLSRRLQTQTFYFVGLNTALPPEVQRLLKWKLSPITPLIVRRTLLQSNFRLVRTSSDWCGTWGKHMKSACFSSIKEFQKMNHFPGTFQIGRKDRLWRNLHRLMLKFGKKEFGFMPRTFILPQDIRLLRQAWEKTCGIERWIVKPPASARGTGIRVVHKWSQIPKKRPLVVQRYIAQPYLINGSKFDLRLYVFVSSIDPLRIYLYDDGLVRFASVKYSSEMSSLHDRYMHLTNYSINKNSSQYTQNENADACQGHKWTVKALWSYLSGQGVDTNALWSRLEDLVVKTLVSGEAAISNLIREHVSSRYCCYELFGVDVLLDSNLRPWLLEVNISPSLHSSSPLDQAVKGPMVCDLLNMAGYHIPNKLPSSMQKELLKTLAPDSKATQLCLDSRFYHVGLSRDEASKQLFFTKDCSEREDYLGQILQTLTSDDVRHLTQAEDELSQVGHFIRVFPTPDSHHYHQFFEGPRYYNMMFDAWENRYNSNRAPGIALLEELCQQKVHLTIPALSARAKSCAEPGDLEGNNNPPLETPTEEEGRVSNSSTGDETEEPTPPPTSQIMRFLARNVLLRAKRQRYPRWPTAVRIPAPPRVRAKIKPSPQQSP
ncbi:hypothetical protein B566_EDAN004827 [Ephemera danica]|nr:hypothetical protein B566_EDAN004827 [Ephemera danica]